jgi:Zinc carboxypeptidase/Dockerin type I domain/Carboxypeptidase regulatory-like domain
MKRWLIILTALVISVYTVSEASNMETYFKFLIKSRDEIGILTRIISIDDVKGDTVFAYANEDELGKFKALGYDYIVLPHPGSLITPKMADTKDEIRAWDSYPTYTSYITMMNQFATDYPALCRIQRIGYSVQGRELLFAKISDNVDDEEDEPEVMFTSSMHGDEVTGYVLMLRLIDYLLSNYGTDSMATRLVDNCEIWINPLANPDGTYHGGNNTVTGATRGNANGVDLNRNYPDPQDGNHPDGYAWQAETICMMDFADAHSFVISANFHGGVEVVNYPWDTWPRLHPDNSWYFDISRKYADTVHVYSPSSYMNYLNNGITNGYAWYEVNGGRQDYMNWWHGCREVTIELSDTKILPGNQLPAHWTYNSSSFLNYLENALYGIRGIVTDSITGLPVFAKVTVIGHDFDQSEIFTDPQVGDYHRMIAPGTYDLEFSAPGYYLKTRRNLNVTSGSIITADVALAPMPNIPDLAFQKHDSYFIFPGEMGNMKVTLVNNGAGIASSVSGALSTADSYITITNSTSTFPDIPALGGTGISTSDFQFSVSPSCPLDHAVDFQLDVMADGGYVNTINFQVFIGRLTEDFESGDFMSFPWEMSGDLPWTIVTSGVYEGTHCARSGAIGNQQYSQMSVSFDNDTAGTISFRYKVSSEANYDFLRFYIDGIQKGQWSGSVGWALASYPVTSGFHTCTWKYSKDQSGVSGSDCGWIDFITFPSPGTSNPPQIATLTLPDWTALRPYSQQLIATGGTGDLSWADKFGQLSGSGLVLSAAGLVSGTPLNDGPIIFTAVVTDQLSRNDEQAYSFTINPVIQISTAILPDGVEGEVYSETLTAGGGTGTKNWSDKNGELAGTGLNISVGGLLSGTPVDSGTILFVARVVDLAGSADEKQFSFHIGPAFICGDVNDDGQVNIRDITYLVDFLYKEGPAPIHPGSGDVNNSGNTNIQDVTYLINYLYKGGAIPVCP